MGNTFTYSKTSKKPKKTVITDTDRAILTLKTQRRKLEDQAKLLEQRIEQYVAAAKELLAEKKKDRAVLALKKKKLNEVQLQKLQAWIINVEDMVNNVELALHQNKVFAALKEGVEAMKVFQKEFSVEAVKQLFDDSAANKEAMDELNSVLAESLSPEQMDAAEEELEMLESEVADEQRLEMPSVPTTKVEVPVIPVEAQAAQQGAREAEQEAEEAAEQEAAPERGQPLLAS